jgi:PAS domain S-box-containing protein
MVTEPLSVSPSNTNDGPYSILIVEDESLVANDLKLLLEKFDYDVVETVSTGEEALEKIDESDPDLILMDIMLDGELNGIETVKKIDENPSPVVYLTAHSDEDTLNRAKKTDPLGYLTKPIDEADLRTTLEVAIERKQTLQKLHQAKNNFETLFNQSSHGLIAVDGDGEITQANDQVSEILGYSREELIGMSVDSLVPSGLRDVHQEHRDNYMDDPEARPMGEGRDLKALTKDGKEVPVEIGLNPIQTEPGPKVIADITDISARKEAEKELRLKERGMESASEGISIAKSGDGANPLIYVNDGFTDITGYDVEEVLGKDCRFLQGENTSEETRAEIRRAIENHEPITTEILNYRKSGEPFWNQLSVTPVTDDEGEITHYIGIQKDITERKQREEDLRLKERAIDSTHEGIIIAEAQDGPDDPIVEVNDGFLEITGYDREDVLGEDCRFLQGEETDRESVKTIRDALERNVPVSQEIINYRKSGEKFWNHVSITPVRDSSGTVTHYIGIQQDVTKQKQQDRALRQSEKLAAIGEMSAGLMHEINNPNAFIQGNIEFIRKGWKRLNGAIDDSLDNDDLDFFRSEMPETISAIEQGTERIENIVNKVKLFAHQKSMNGEREIFDPCDAVDNALDMVIVDHDESVLTVNVDEELRDGQHRVRSDRNELKQVVMNLVENAYDAVSNQDNPVVTLAMKCVDGDFQLTITDNGPGISEKNQSKIFDPFFTTKKTGEGTGLGLSIVKGIVDRSGGDISLDTTPGKGTTFTVTFPLHESE